MKLGSEYFRGERRVSEENLRIYLDMNLKNLENVPWKFPFITLLIFIYLNL